jgi:hypothetical protein
MNSASTIQPSQIQDQLDSLIQRVRKDSRRVPDPGFRALLDTTVEVLLGLKSAYRHNEGRMNLSDRPEERLGPEKANYYRSHLSPH